MGSADIKANFGKGQKHELNVSTYQMCVLMVFNDADRLSYKEIEQATQIPASDLKRCLQSLALVKGRNVLRKEPLSKDVAEDDSFFVNDKFSSKLYKVKIGTVVAQKESEPEKLETRQRMEEDRKPQIEAAIVRIMKSRKCLDHNNLVAEVTKQLQSRFLANPTEVSISNGGSVIGGLIGAGLTQIFGITKDRFDNLATLIILCKFSSLLPLPLLGLLPGDDPDANLGFMFKNIYIYLYYLVFCTLWNAKL